MSIHLLTRDGLEQIDELRTQGIFNHFVLIRRDLRGRGRVRRELDLADGRDESDDFDAVDHRKVLLSDGACSHTANGLASTATTSTAASFHAVLLKVGPVGMARTRVKVCFCVVPGALVFILYKKTNRGAEGDSLLDTRLKLAI